MNNNNNKDCLSVWEWTVKELINHSIRKGNTKEQTDDNTQDREQEGKTP
jgi:hypothetical protein